MQLVYVYIPYKCKHTHVATSCVLVHMLHMCVHAHMTTHDTSPPISTTHVHTHMCTHTHSQTSAESAHTHNPQQSVWRKVPDVPNTLSSICVVDGELLAIGGQEDRQDGSRKTSSIYGLHLDEKKWRLVGDLPFACSTVDTLLLSGGGLLMVDGYTQQVLKITVQGKYFCTGIEIELI